MTKRTTITIPETLYAEAERLMREQHFNDFSGFVQHLIRAENERRQDHELKLADAAERAQALHPASKPVNYKKSFRKPKGKVA